MQSKATAVNRQIVSYGTMKQFFRYWLISYEKVQRFNVRLIRKMKSVSEIVLQKRCFKQWREYINQQYVEREIDSRVDRTWMKVQKWLL